MVFAGSRSMSLGGLVAVVTLSGAACQGNAGNPVAPSTVGGVFSGASLAESPSGGNAQPLIEVTGSAPQGGAGTANAVPTAAPDANVIEVTVNVQGAPPDTDLYFQIAHDVPLGPVPARADGVCDRALTVGFPNPPLHAGGDAGVIRTSAGGAGSTHIRFALPTGFAGGAYEPGAQVDQMFRVVNLSKSFELRTPCMTMTWR